MRHVITFIAENANLIDLHATVQRLTARFAGMPIHSLGPNACDVEIEYRLPAADWQALRDATVAARIDCVMQPLPNREKKLLIADMDSTIIEQECLDELADCVGQRAAVSAITERAMNGELDFAEALRERVALLAGLPCSALQRVFSERITFTPGAVTLVATMKQRGGYAVLVSGGFEFFTGRVAHAIGFDGDEANRLELLQNHVTGRVVPPILDREAKRQSLLRHARQRSIPLSATLAVGDGANDLPMLRAAGLGVAYHAKPIVMAEAAAAIRFTDLTALLYLQGIPQRDWIAA